MALAPASELIEGFAPENELERRLAEDPVVVKGWAWGEPRTGHPEGPVGSHVADLLQTIEDWNEPEPRRSDLRFVALLHDALKYKVHEWLPHSGPNHHAVRARHRQHQAQERGAAPGDEVAGSERCKHARGDAPAGSVPGLAGLHGGSRGRW